MVVWSGPWAGPLPVVSGVENEWETDLEDSESEGDLIKITHSVKELQLIRISVTAPLRWPRRLNRRTSQPFPRPSLLHTTTTAF